MHMYLFSPDLRLPYRKHQSRSRCSGQIARVRVGMCSTFSALLRKIPIQRQGTSRLQIDMG